MAVYINEHGNLATITGNTKGAKLQILSGKDNQITLALFEAAADYRGDVALHTDDMVQALVKLGILTEHKTTLLTRRQ